MMWTPSSWTDADVAASDDLTGHVSLGGNWILEAQAGEVEATALVADDWQGLLAPGDFQVKDVFVDEDGNLLTDGDTDPANDPELFGVTLNPSLREGGQLANVIDTEVAFGNLRDVQTFTIPAGENPTSVRLTVFGSDSDNIEFNTHATNTYDQDHFQASITVDLINGTYSGIVQDFSQLNTGKFTFADQLLGIAGSTAPVAEGDTSGITRDVIVDYNSATGEITVDFVDSDTLDAANMPERGGADQGAYLAEYLDATDSSLDFIATDPIVGNFVNQGATESRITLADSPDQITLSISLGDARQGNRSYDEPRGAGRLIFQKQADGTYLANGAVAFTGADFASSARVSTYSIADYVVGTDANTALLLTDSAGATDDTTAGVSDLYDAQIYIDTATNELVIKEVAGFASRISLYNAERYALAKDAGGNNIGSSGVYLGTTIGEGDLTVANSATGGADFTFEIPTGSTFGNINFAGQNGVQENGGVVGMRIQLERDPVTGELIGGTSAGTSVALRNKVPTFVAWSGIDLTTGTQLVQSAGDSTTVPGVETNLYNLSHDDPSWAGMTITLDQLNGKDVIRVEMVRAVSKHGVYTMSGVSSEWFGSPAVVMENVPEGVSFALITLMVLLMLMFT